MRLTLAITTIVLTTMLVACGNDKENQMRSIDDVASQARRDIDALAAQLGTSPQVKQDVITDCIPGQEDSGKDLIYSVHVTIAPGALNRLKGEIADDLAARGWTVTRGPGPEEVSFAKGSATMGAAVREDLGLADVGGSGGCVK